MNSSFDVPVLFIIFNRPETTRQVFDVIKMVKPRTLYIAADGARDNVPGEKERVEESRRIATAVDWDCDVHKLFSARNLGCKVGESSGMNWLFENEEYGIILEDDTLPDPSFFPFCRELLRTFQNESKVHAISGTNLQLGREAMEDSYYFSRYTHSWGWASWRRAWKNYDVTMKDWPDYRNRTDLFDAMSPAEIRFWRNVLDQYYYGEIDTWDYPWLFTCWKQKSFQVLPKVNLIQNIGFGRGATHTKNVQLKPPTRLESMTFPLVHPSRILRNERADAFTYQRYFKPVLKEQAYFIFLKVRRFLRAFLKQMAGQRQVG